MCVIVLPTASVTPGDHLIFLSGMILELTCVTGGFPPPQVTWSRNGRSLEDDGNRIVIDEASLIITALEPGDSGEYYCSASSSAGLVSSSVDVSVLLEETQEDMVTLAVVRENAVLECSSEVPPGVPVSWTFNGSTLAPLSDKYVILGNGSLLILDLWFEDMGDYICQLGNINITRTLNLTGRSTNLW